MALDAPALGLLVLVVYPLLQIPVVLYLSRYVELRDGESAPHPAEGYALHADRDDGGGHPAHPEAPLPPDRGTVCGRCGAANGPEYRYCRDCVARLA